MGRALAFGVAFAALACRPSPRPPSVPADTGCIIRGTLLQDTLIGMDAESLTIATAVGMAVRLRHAIDYRRPVVFPGDVLAVWCHAEGHRPFGSTLVDTVVDSLVIVRLAGDR